MDFQEAFSKLKNLQQLESPDEVRDLRPHRVRTGILDPTQLAYAALCQIELLRLYAPNLPWSGRDLDGAFTTFSEAIDLLHSASDQPDIVSAVTELLSKMTGLQIAGCIEELPHPEKFVVDTFDAAYRAAHTPNISSRARYLICQLLSQIVDEMEYEIPDDAVCLFLDQFNGEAASLSREIAQNCPRVEERVKKYFLALLDDTEANDRFDQAAELAKGVIEHSFPVFELSLPLFVQRLEMLLPEARAMAVKVIGWTLVSHPAIHDLEFHRWVKRSLDASANVRVAWVRVAANCLSRSSLEIDYTDVWNSFFGCLNDSDSKVRAAAAGAVALFVNLADPPKSLEQMLVPRLRDKSVTVQSKALDAALDLYNVSSCTWVPKAVLNMVYVYNQKSLDLLWGLTLEMCDITHEPSYKVARSVVTTLSYLDSKAAKAFSAVYRNHVAIAKALSHFLESEESQHDTLLEWISNRLYDSRIKVQLSQLTTEQQEVLKLALGPSPSNEVYENSQEYLPKAISPLVIRYGGYLEQNTSSFIELLDDSQLGEASASLLSEIAAGFPKTVVANADQLVKRALQNDKALCILSAIANELDGELEADDKFWQHIEEKVFSRDENLTQHAVKLIALLGPGNLLSEVTNEIMAMVLETPSASALAALNTLYMESPTTILSHSDASLIPQQLIKIIQSSGDDEVHIVAMHALVARLRAIDSRPNSYSSKAEPVLKFFRKVLDDGKAGDRISSEAAALWFKLASAYVKQTDFADVARLQPIFSVSMAASLIRELRDSHLSLIYTPLLFLDEKLFQLVEVGIPTLEKSDHDIGIMFAYLLYYVAAERVSLAVTSASIKRFCWAAVTEKTLEAAYHVASRIKQFRDVRDPPAAPDLEPTPSSKRLYAVSELAIKILDRHMRFAGLTFRATISKPMALPRKVYQSCSSAAASQLVAETEFLSELGSPEEIAEVCDDLRKRIHSLSQAHAKTKKRRSQRPATPNKNATPS